jgi:hypothetical protein
MGNRDAWLVRRAADRLIAWAAMQGLPTPSEWEELLYLADRLDQCVMPEVVSEDHHG